jgi:hypothetical protein
MVGVPLGAPLFSSARLLTPAWRDLLLPVSKWLVAKKPVPLPVPRITNSVVGVHCVVQVICIETPEISGIRVA